MKLNLDIFKKFSLSKLQGRERYLFYFIVILLSLLLLDNLVFKKIANTFRDLTEKIAKQELVCKRSISLVANKSYILFQFANYKEYFGSKGKSTKDSLPTILSHLESAARKNNVILSDVKPKRKVKEGRYSFRYPVELSLEGGLPSILDFFYELDNGRLLINTKEVSITLKKDLLKLKIDLEAVVFK